MQGRVGIMLYARWGGNKPTYACVVLCRLLLVLMMNGHGRIDGWMYVVERVGWLYDGLPRRVVHGAFPSESWSAVHNCSVSALSTPFRSSFSRVWAFHALVKNIR